MEMYFKLALGNVKKSFKDYTIYFLTLTLAVAIFYSFNSIGAQKAFTELESSGKNYVGMLTNIIGYVSVFVSIILGSLMLYANNFLVKKRKKELGIYMTLGMGKRKISKILITETILVGIMSLISGLLLGILASQGLSIFTSNLFDVAMSEYSFVISTTAIIKTIIYFGIIFLLIMIFNTIIISKYKIIDLLTSGRKNQDITFKNPLIYLITFILCVVSLGFAYKFALEVGLNIQNPKFLISILLGIVGTVLFFFSLAGFILYIVKKNKKVYFKGLNIFVVKQINSKVNTNFLSMSIICLMLFITIAVLSTGLSFKNAVESSLEGATPYDASATIYIYSEDKVKSMEDSLKNVGFKFNNNERYVFLNEYYADTKIKDLFSLSEENSSNDFNVSFVKESEYNKARSIRNKEAIKLGENQVLILSNFEKSKKVINKALEKSTKVNIKGKEYTSINNKAIEENLTTTYMQNNMITVVINDEFCKEAEWASSNVNVNFPEDNKKVVEEKYRKLFDIYRDKHVDCDKTGLVIASTRQETYEQNKGLTTILLFIGIYLGIVFLISSMAILSLQQLSEASDSIERYKSLKRLGANEKSIHKTIFAQTIIYFSIPVTLALIHSIVGINVANNFITLYNQPNVGAASLITATIFMVVYIGYFYATYTGYKNIVKSNL